MSSTADICVVISGEVIDSLANHPVYKTLQENFTLTSEKRNAKKDVAFNYEEGLYSDIFDLISELTVDNENLSPDHYYVEYSWWGDRGDTQCFGKFQSDVCDTNYISNG